MVVVGAGVAGLTVANLLRRSGVGYVVLERHGRAQLEQRQRASVPPDELTTYRFADDVGWFTVLADAPPPRYPLFGISRHGFAAHFGRGPSASRFYLQCPVGDDPQTWSDERV